MLVGTSGEQPWTVSGGDDKPIMDLKCPDSGESARNRVENIQQLNVRDEVKFVLASRRDYEYARDAIRESMSWDAA